MTEHAPLLELSDMSVKYKTREGYVSAVSHVDMEVRQSEVFALVGESGCGKSTVAHAVMRLLMEGNEQISGRAIFKGTTDLLHIPEREMEGIRGKSIGMIFQNPMDSLNPVYRVGSQVSEAVRLDRIGSREAYERVLELFRDVRLPDAEKRYYSYPHELSGGMRQRVMIAMMLSRRPDLLIADEPTTALDVTIEAQILEILKELKQSFGMSILLITHNFGLIAELADRIGVMYAGVIVETGGAQDIFSNPVHPYTRLLLRALPRGYKGDARLEVIPGSVPRLIGEVRGCRFANRCPAAAPECSLEDPPVKQAGDGHSYRCHLEKEALNL